MFITAPRLAPAGAGRVHGPSPPVQSEYGRAERGEKLPKLEIFIRIANALKISSDALLIDLLAVRNDIIASDLSDQLSSLPQTEKRRILSIIQTMVDSYKQC